ncbi:hypothetical protein [Streptomyces sp. PD-S100-1]|uniref:hypothetical protein n=1 Tax=Streptomyces sp. PD-S100-1 TaxID=3394351 RepID=UPI0039BC3D6C
MADHEDQELTQLAIDVAVGYAQIMTALRHLPIPIQLPEGLVEPKDAVIGMMRALDLLEEEPLPEGIAHSIQVACASWLNAEDLLRLQVHRPRPYRIAGATICLLTAQTEIVNAMEWLVDHQEDGEQK